MATLTGHSVQSRFKDYCQISNANSGIDATKRAIEDGEGTASKLELSTTAVNIISGFELNDVAAQTGSVLKHEVGGLEFDASAIADGGMVVGTASGTMAIRSSFLTAGAAGFVKHEVGGLEIDISAITTDEFIVGQSSGVVAVRTPAQARTHLGLVVGTDVQADLAVPSQAEAEAGTATTERVWTAERVKQAATELFFVSGTVMLFHQDAAPTGWTKDTASTLDNSALRVVASTAWTSGKQGATAFDSVFGSSKVVGGTALTKAELPNPITSTAGTIVVASSGGQTALRSASSGSGSVTNTGGGNTHNHTLSLDLNYINMILATKD